MRLVPILLLLASCTSPDAAGQASEKLTPAFPGLSFTAPVDIQAPPGGGTDLYVVEQPGRIVRFAEDDAAVTSSVFLDIRARVASGGERGLLGMAFHPRFPDSAYVYVNYTAPNPLHTVIARFTVAGGAADPTSEKPLLTVAQPYSNHNAGQIQFGPDGYLYVGLGDGGSGGDPNGNGQNRTTLLGSLLRLDVDGGGLPADCGGAAAGYTLPADNPFVNQTGACGEIYAYGLRNPWRFSFGPDGTLFVADVGQGRREEVNVVTAGGNYGWNAMEGSLCYPSGEPCAVAGTVLPVAEYPHDADTGGFSTTGGYVYTGPESGCAFLKDRYVYGDYLSGNLWSLGLADGTADVKPLAKNIGINVSTFGVGHAGALYLADLNGGALYRLDCEALGTASTPPDVPKGLHLSPATPHPARGAASLVLTGPVGARTRVEVYDVLGRAMTTLFDGVLTFRDTEVVFDAARLPAGLYVLRARSGVAQASRTVTVVR